MVLAPEYTYSPGDFFMPILGNLNFLLILNCKIYMYIPLTV